MRLKSTLTRLLTRFEEALDQCLKSTLKNDTSALPGAATRSGTPPSSKKQRVPHRIASRPPASAARVRPARRERLSAHRPAVLCPTPSRTGFFHRPSARSCSGYLASPHRPSSTGCPGPRFAGRRFLATRLGLDGVGGWPVRAGAYRRVGAVPPRKKPVRSGRWIEVRGHPRHSPDDRTRRDTDDAAIEIVRARGDARGIGVDDAYTDV